MVVVVVLKSTTNKNSNNKAPANSMPNNNNKSQIKSLRYQLFSRCASSLYHGFLLFYFWNVGPKPQLRWKVNSKFFLFLICNHCNGGAQCSAVRFFTTRKFGYIIWVYENWYYLEAYGKTFPTSGHMKNRFRSNAWKCVCLYRNFFKSWI